MGLDLNEAAIVDVEELDLNLVTIEDIEAELEKKGFRTFPRPEGDLEALADVDVNQLTNDELAALYSKYVAYQAYLSTEVARAGVEKSAADRNLKQVTAKLKSAFHAKGVKEKEIIERVRLHPLYIEYDAEYARARYMHEILEAYDRSYGKQAAGLSRCVELRKIELQQAQRDGNLGRPGSPSFGKGPPITRPHRRGSTKAPEVKGKEKRARDAD